MWQLIKSSFRTKRDLFVLHSVKGHPAFTLTGCHFQLSTPLKHASDLCAQAVLSPGCGLKA